MSRRIDWSARALDDFDQAITFIAKDNPAAARRLAGTIDQSAQKLAQIPTGRPGRVTGTYEKKVSRLPYILAYALPDDSRVVILRVIHTARHWPLAEWPD